MMAQKLLSLHMNKAKEQHEIKDIVDNLTSKLYYHGHPINRKEAQEQIGLRTVINADSELEPIMWDLYLEYENEIKADDPFDPLMDFVSQNQDLQVGHGNSIEIASKLAYIESTFRTDFVEIKHSVYGTKQANGTYQIVPNITSRDWKIE